MTEKELIKVYIMLGDPSNGILTHKRIIDGQKDYYGYGWDLFQTIKNTPEIKDKYNFKLIFSKFGDNNYDESVNKVSKGIYDLSIGLYIHTLERDKKILYTKPVLIDDIGIFHYENTDILKIAIYTTKKLSYLIFILIIFGIITGLLLYFFEPDRKFYSINKKLFLNRSILTGIATFFGEMGYLTEHSYPKFQNIILITFIMFISFIIGLYIQAKFTALLIENDRDKKLYLKEFKLKPLVAHEGYAMAQKLEQIGLKIKYFKNVTNKELFDEYVNNSNKYAGVAISYADGFSFLKQIYGLTVNHNFGHEINSFIVNPKKKQFLRDINNVITKMRISKKINKICKSHYYNPLDGFLITPDDKAICNLI